MTTVRPPPGTRTPTPAVYFATLLRANLCIPQNGPAPHLHAVAWVPHRQHRRRQGPARRHRLRVAAPVGVDDLGQAGVRRRT